MIDTAQLHTLLNDPIGGHFIVLGGTEYGMKELMINNAADSLNWPILQIPSVNELLSLFSKKHIIPPEVAIYLVRYDEEFISTLDAKLSAQINRLKITGNIIVLYENEKQCAKVDKFLPNNIGMIDNVSTLVMMKHLDKEFPRLSKNLKTIAIDVSQNYGHARKICQAMSLVDESELTKLTSPEIAKLFGYSEQSTEAQVRMSVAAKNFNSCVSLLDKFPEEADKMVYIILQTMIDLEKCKCSKFANMDISKYAKDWQIPDIYYMFMSAYSELKKLRWASLADTNNSLIYLFGLLNYAQIPSPEVMNQ